MKFKLVNVRPSFPSLFKLDKYDSYSARFIIENKSQALKDLSAAIDVVGDDKWKDKWPQVKKALAKADKAGIHEGSDERPEHKDASYINAKNTVRPTVVDKQAKIQFEDTGLIYSGCRADAILDIYAGTHEKSGPYIGIKLLGVQFRGDDEAFTATSKAEESDFETIADGADADDL